MKKEKFDFDSVLYSNIFENATIGVVVVNQEGLIRQVNPFAEQLFGYEPQELEGERLHILIPEKSKPIHHKLRTSYFDNPVPRPMGVGRELSGQKKDGTTFPLEISLSSAIVKGERFAIAFVSNVKERVEAIRKMAESEKHLSTIIDAVVDGIITINREGIVQTINPAIEKLFGYSEEEIIGKSIEILMPEPYHSEHEGYLNNYHTSHKKKIIGIGREVYGCKKGGTVFPLYLGVSEAMADNKPIYIGVIHDLTDRKKAEKAAIEKQEYLQNYAESLQKEVEIRTSELRESEEKLKFSLGKERELGELKSRFVSMASHEFRTPLSTVLSSTELLEMYAEVGKYDKLQKHFTLIKNSVANLNNILNDFLSLEKVEAGLVTLNLQSTDLNTLTSEVKEEIKLLLKSGQRIVLKKEGDMTAFIDAFLVRNILLNILSNAIKYSPEDKDIHWTIENNTDHILISVKDEGIGIPEKEQQNMFTRFYRASNASAIKGTGLGLTIIKRHLDLMQGDIFFESKEGEGTTFRVSIPLKNK